MDSERPTDLNAKEQRALEAFEDLMRESHFWRDRARALQEKAIAAEDKYHALLNIKLFDAKRLGEKIAAKRKRDAERARLEPAVVPQRPRPSSLFRSILVSLGLRDK